MGAVGVSAMEKRIKVFGNFPFGVFVGCVSILALLWIVDSSVSDQIEDIAIKLFSGIITLVAATLALAEF